MTDKSALSRTEIGLLALTLIVMVVAHWHWLPIELSAGFLALLGLRLAWATWRPGQVPMLIRLAATVGILGLLVAAVGAPFGREGGSALLICLLALKLLETQNRRDARILVAVAFFATMITFLFSQQILATGYALFVAAFLFAGLHGLTPSFNGGARNLMDSVRRALPMTGRLAIASIPLTLLAFMFFPRLASPLWGAPWDSRAGKTGLSDRMQPGMMSGMWSDNTPVFRATFKGPLPAPQQRYWRGPVLWDFDGSTWTGADRFIYETEPLVTHEPGSTVEYEVMMEPTEQRWLFPLDMPIGMTGSGARMLSDGQVMTRRPLIEPRKYLFRSAFRYALEERLQLTHRTVALRLPRNSNPRARALGESLRERHGEDGRAITNDILTMIQRDFVYTLEPPPLMMDRPVDDFLFQTKEGYCEHFSSAYVFLMRSAGIPARVVTGYLGGLYNPTGDYMLVRNSDAHAWAEFWSPGEGWIRVDPTGAVAPERINQGTVGGALPNAIRWYEDGWLGELGLRMDWVSASWRNLVIEFNAERQRDMLQPFGIPEIGVRGMTLALSIFGALALALGVWWSTRGRRQHNPDLLGRAWKRFVRRLERKGLPVEASEGPQHLLQRARTRWPDHTDELDGLFRDFIALRYGHADPALAKDLIRRLRRWRPS